VAKLQRVNSQLPRQYIAHPLKTGWAIPRQARTDRFWVHRGGETAMVCEKLADHGASGLTRRPRAMDSQGRSHARAPVTGPDRAVGTPGAGTAK